MKSAKEMATEFVNVANGYDDPDDPMTKQLAALLHAYGEQVKEMAAQRVEGNSKTLAVHIRQMELP